MAFVLKKVASYKWPVTVETPIDGGKFEKTTFDATFRKMSRSAFNNLVEEGDDACLIRFLKAGTALRTKTERMCLLRKKPSKNFAMTLTWSEH
jgi:hypothetical protein